jgi:preprotein translocase subunit SecA
LVIEKIGQIGEGRKLKRLEQLVALVNTFEPEVEDLTDEQLRGKTPSKPRADGATLEDRSPRPSRACARPPAGGSASGTSTSR